MNDTGKMGIAGLWEPFGLRSSPFFQDELAPADPEHPTTLFVGREEDVRRVQRRIASDPHTRTIVEGNPGVGKTSFVNRIKADADDLGLVSWNQPVRITQETTLSSFLADVLRTVLRLRSAAGLSNSAGRLWPRIVRWLEGDEVRAGSVSVLGVGAGVTRSHVPPRAPVEPLYEFVSHAFAETSSELGRNLLVHVNNLENLTVEQAGELALLLRDLRDYLLLPGAHWIFVGTTGVEHTVFRAYDQVGGIFPAAITLDALSSVDIRELLRLRIEHLTISGARVTVPIGPEEAAVLYRLYQGDLRNFLRLLADAAERILGVQGIRPMAVSEVLQHTAADYARRLRAVLGDTDFEYLQSVVLPMSSRGYEFRVTDATKVLKVSQSSATRLVDRLLSQRVIRQTRTEGRSVFYRPTGDALVALGVTNVASTEETEDIDR